LNVLVTGGAGFIGSHLCAALVARGDSVTCVDDLSTSTFDNLSEVGDRLRFVRSDVTDYTPDFRPDAIFHLACPASPVHYQADPVKTMRTTLMGTVRMLDFARAAGSKMVFASTSEVYGDPSVSPQPESYWGSVNPVGVRSCYDEGKRAGESMCYAWRHQYGVDARVARIFNTYGPNMGHDDGRLLPNIIMQALAGAPVTVYGDGSQTRSFCYVSDTVEGLVALSSAEVLRFPVVNVGNPDERTVLSVARDVVSSVGSASRVELRPLPQDDPRRRCPDITLAKELLKWQPKVPFESGLARTISWFRSSSARPVPL